MIGVGGRMELAPEQRWDGGYTVDSEFRHGLDRPLSGIATSALDDCSRGQASSPSSIGRLLHFQALLPCVSEPNLAIRYRHGNHSPLRRSYSVPFFMHPRSEMSLAALPGCVDSENPKHWDDITAGEFLDQRLREIGLKK